MRNHIPTPLLVLAIFFCLVSVYRLGSWGVIDTSEARYSDIPRQMYEQGDYLHPLYLGVHHYHKPPLTYYITTAGYHLFGPSAFGARIVLHIALLVQFFLIWRIARDWYADKQKAALAVMIYSSFFILWIGARNLTTDLYLCTFLLGTIWALMRYASTSRPGYLYLGAVVGGLAFLTKFTASLVILGPMALTIWWLHRKSWKWSWHFIPAAVVYLGVALSWFLALEAEGKPILRYLLYDHSVVRYTTDAFQRNEPFYMYLIAAPLLAFPWLPLLIHALYYQWRKKTLDRKTLVLFCVWTVFPILFYSLSHSKLILYILPAFPAIALMATHHADALEARVLKRWFGAQLVFTALLLVGLFTYPLYTEYSTQSLIQIGLTVSLTAILAWIFTQKQIGTVMRMGLFSAVFTLGLVMISTHILSDNADSLSSAAPVAEWIREEGLQDRDIFVFDRLAPSLSFHTRQRIATVTLNEKRELQFETDDLWKRQYFNLSREADAVRLQQRLAAPAIIVARRRAEVPGELLTNLGSVKEIGKWKVYY